MKRLHTVGFNKMTSWKNQICGDSKDQWLAGAQWEGEGGQAERRGFLAQ